jgi:hypothetical protein
VKKVTPVHQYRLAEVLRINRWMDGCDVVCVEEEECYESLLINKR